MYKLTTLDAYELSEDIKNATIKVEQTRITHSLIFNKELGATICVPTDDSTHEYGMNIIVEISHT